MHKEFANSLMEKKKNRGHPVLKQDFENGQLLFDLDKYKNQVRWRLLENKIQSRLFFIENLYRYPRGIAWQSAMGVVASRMEKKKNDGRC